MTVGERIKQKRIELGLTQEELAIKMGYKGKTSVCVAETKGDNVTTTKVMKFAKALGVSVQYLLGDLDEPQDTPKAQAIREDYVENSTDAAHTDVNVVISEEDRLLLHRLHRVRQSTLDSINLLIQADLHDS